jgi:hypothetical protein
MRKIITEHLISLLLVGGLFATLIFHIHQLKQVEFLRQDAELETLIQLDFMDLGDPLHKALLRETLNTFRPDAMAQNDSLLRALEAYRAEQITSIQRQRRIQTITTPGKFSQLLRMYIQFIAAYIIVIFMTYYSVQTLGVLRFARYRQRHPGYIALLWQHLTASPFPLKGDALAVYLRKFSILLIKASGVAVAYVILFSPAYVIAYVFKTRVATDSFLFLVVLGVISNGLLITYAQKFYTFLLSESRRGYVETAIVKNLNNNYHFHTPNGLRLKDIFRWNKRFEGHVLEHIYENAHYQYLATIKEQASFVITGLVIIEMALNIQGHLCYELLQNLLFKQYDIALVIILGIFIVVKLTEIATDFQIYQVNRKYTNNNQL